MPSKDSQEKKFRGRGRKGPSAWEIKPLSTTQIHTGLQAMRDGESGPFSGSIEGKRSKLKKATDLPITCSKNSGERANSCRRKAQKRSGGNG